jgi:hypothetical protein
MEARLRVEGGGVLRQRSPAVAGAAAPLGPFFALVSRLAESAGTVGARWTSQSDDD